MTAIVLIGIPGAGKSTVGQALARRLALPFIDVDDVIERAAGKPISDIFTQDGEPAFRALEARSIADILGSPEAAVVALGGGALGDEGTRTLVAAHTTVWLQASLTAAAERVGLNRNRPLLLGNVRGQLADLMAKRLPIYEAAADIAIETSEVPVDEVVERIVSALAEHK